MWASCTWYNRFHVNCCVCRRFVIFWSSSPSGLWRQPTCWQKWPERPWSMRGTQSLSDVNIWLIAKLELIIQKIYDSFCLFIDPLVVSFYFFQSFPTSVFNWSSPQVIWSSPNFSLSLFRLPTFSLPCAIDVLTLGSYPRLPSCIRVSVSEFVDDWFMNNFAHFTH